MESFELVAITRGYVVKVDLEDAKAVRELKWHAHLSKVGVYARNNTVGRMHRWLSGAQPGECVDHINGDTLDNRRENLRLVTYSQNEANKRKRRDSQWRYKGVEKVWNRWRAVIEHAGKRTRSGSFGSQLEAALAYDEMAISIHGEHARLNFPERQPKRVYLTKGLKQ